MNIPGLRSLAGSVRRVVNTRLGGISIIAVSLVVCGIAILRAQEPKKSGAAPPKAAPAKATPAKTAQAEPEAAPSAKYAEIRPLTPAEEKVMRKNQFAIKKQLEGKEPLDGLFDKYILTYMLPQTTQVQHLTEVRALHDDLMNGFRVATSRNNPTAIAHLNELIYDFMSAVARGTVRAVAADGRGVDVLRLGTSANPRYFMLNMKSIPSEKVAREAPPEKNFHPGVRYNAMLLIGLLNEKMEIRRANGVVTTKAVPLLAMLQPLLDVSIDESLPDFVRTAAVTGVRRHVNEGELLPGSKELVVNAMVKAIERRGNPAPAAAAGRTWIRAQAIDTLKDNGLDGTNQIVSQTLLKLIGESTEPLSLRLSAARALGTIKRDKVRPDTAVDLAKQLESLAVEVIDYELSPSSEKQPPFSRRRAAAGLGAVIEGLGGRPALDAIIDPNSKVPLGGTYALVGPEDKPFVKGLIDRIAGLRMACANDTLSEPTLRSTLSTGAKDLDSFAVAGPKAAVSTGPAPMAPAAGPMQPATPTAHPPGDNPFDLTPQAEKK